MLNQHSWEMNKLLQPNQEGRHNVFSPQEVMKAEFILQNITRGVCHKLKINELQLFLWSWKVHFQ